MTRLTAIAAAAALTTLTFGAALAPVHAAEADCATMSADIRIAAQGADAKEAKRAIRKADIGQALCEAGNERAAGKKFAQALKSLGISKEQFAQR